MHSGRSVTLLSYWPQSQIRSEQIPLSHILQVEWTVVQVYNRTRHHCDLGEPVRPEHCDVCCTHQAPFIWTSFIIILPQTLEVRKRQKKPTQQLLKTMPLLFITAVCLPELFIHPSNTRVAHPVPLAVTVSCNQAVTCDVMVTVGAANPLQRLD